MSLLRICIIQLSISTYLFHRLRIVKVSLQPKRLNILTDYSCVIRIKEV